MAHLLPAIAACVIFLGAYVLIATEKWVTRTAAALGGAALVLALGISDAEAAFFSDETGVDWNVVFLLLGMMIIVGVMRETGVFEYLAIWAAKRARGRPFPLMVLLILITAVASALLDNVTTVLLIAPVSILLCRRLGLPVVPYLLAEVFASNIGGTATLVGDPPNIIIASRGGLSFNDFLVHLAPVVVVLLAVLIGLCRWLFADAFRTDEERVAEILALNEREAIKDHRLLRQSLAVLGVVLTAFVLSPVLGYQPSVVALLGAGLLIAITRVTTETADEMPTDQLSLTFAALADPTRRSILTLPAISRHLQVLERAGLITRSREAQWRHNRLRAAPLHDAVVWMQQRTRTWQARMDRLEAHLRQDAHPDKQGTDDERLNPDGN